MRVGIVTEPLVANYGGIIQNYALQKALSICGHESITLRYMSSLSFLHYCLYVGKNLLLGLHRRNIVLKPYRRFTEIPDNISPFINGKICMTKPMSRYSASSIKKYGIGALVVGSDQVWRKEYNQNLYDMYLAFADGLNLRRVAYAASFGTSHWTYSTEMTARCSELLHKFDFVSLREISGADMCCEHFGVTAKVVLDPTLLLHRHDYEDLCKDVQTSNRHYLLAYFLDSNVEKSDFVLRLAESLSLELVSMSVSKNDKTTVEEWLARYRDASYVVTDSFHGTVFSIIFQRQFLTIANSNRGTDRFITLLSKLDLLDNLVCNLSTLQKDMVLPKVDYNEVDRHLSKLRTESYAFLKNSLNG